MSDFWKLSDGNDVEANDSFDAGGGKIEVIPEGSQVLAAIDEAKWSKNQKGDEFISLRWAVIAPEDYANRKIFQKLWVTDFDPSAAAKGEDKALAKRDKAKKMLAAIDSNAVARLHAIAEVGWLTVDSYSSGLYPAFHFPARAEPGARQHLLQLLA